VKLRTADDIVYHLNDYHFIYLFRNVTADKVGQSRTKHVVLLDNFHDWSGLLAVAENKRNGESFKYGNYQFGLKNREIYPVSGPNHVQLTGVDITNLAVYLSTDTTEPAERRADADYTQARKAVIELKRNSRSTDMAYQWPAKRPHGVTYKAGSTGPVKNEHFVWGAGGGVDWPHIHCFVNPEGDLYAAHATLSPLGGQEKRAFDFRQDLTVDRGNGPVPSDDVVLTELEKVLKAVVFGEDHTASPTAALDELRQAAEVYVQDKKAPEDGYVLNVEWVIQVVRGEIEPEDLADMGVDSLEAMASVATVRQWVKKKS
jgi:hypothetical protein